MAAQLTAKEMARLEVLYKRGERIEDICHRLRITHRTVHYHANNKGWVHGENKKEHLAKLAVKEEENLLKAGVKEADKIRENYLAKVQVLENMMNATLRALGTTPEEIRNVKKAEADRVFAILKNLKISSEISAMHYEASRKALGLDMITNTEESDVLPIKINVTQQRRVIEDDSSIQSDDEEATSL
jgi:hypothetical protein